MSVHVVTEFSIAETMAAIIIALAYITLFSLLREPNRQNLSAIIVAGAGGVYLSGGLGVWEFAFSSIMLFMAFKGHKHYYFIGIGWLMHSAWDIMHHFYGNPIVPFNPSSSAGCCICDIILAAWFFFGAPSVFEILKSRKTAISE